MNKLIVIGAAMDQELNPILKESKIKKEIKVANLTIYEVELLGREVILYKTNIGRTNASLATAIVLQRYKKDIKEVINVGSSGAGREDQGIMKTVISDELNYSENTVEGWKKGQVPYMPEVYKTDGKLQEKFKKIMNPEIHEVGNFVCSESFLSSQAVLAEAILSNPIEISSIDMESTAVAQVCYAFNVPFIGLRTISDNIFLENAKDSNEQFEENINHVHKGYFTLLKKYLKEN
ncbi:5'-methylthioadenosine/S-adenosylhomocysteine nucleosidase [Mycoplasma todarodis]|uniref:5'-methylthioadenosine/S-adenosylhomocysteine nucleosidase n=1 Tax=Mycoplasma todarodis TaxID=1937191 RepID=UPI003B38649F